MNTYCVYYHHRCCGPQEGIGLPETFPFVGITFSNHVFAIWLLQLLQEENHHRMTANRCIIVRTERKRNPSGLTVKTPPLDGREVISRFKCFIGGRERSRLFLHSSDRPLCSQCFCALLHGFMHLSCCVQVRLSIGSSVAQSFYGCVFVSL